MNKRLNKLLGLLMIDSISIALLFVGGYATNIVIGWFWVMFGVVGFILASGKADDIKKERDPAWYFAINSLASIAVLYSIYHQGFYITAALYLVASLVAVTFKFRKDDKHNEDKGLKPARNVPKMPKVKTPKS